MMIRPTSPGMNTAPVQGPQKAEAKAPAQKAEAPAAAKEQTEVLARDEDKTTKFEEKEMDVNAFPFDMEAVEESDEAAEIEEVESLEEAEETGETEELDDVEDIEEAEEPEETEETEADNTVSEEEEEGGVGDFDEEAGGSEAEAPQINTQVLLAMVPEMRDLPRFRLEETWALFK